MLRSVIGALMLLVVEGCNPLTCPRVEMIFPCRCAPSAYCGVPEARCSGIRESPRLQAALMHFANNGLMNLKIDYCLMDLCGDFFPNGLRMRVLRIRNSRLRWNPESRPLERLADTLERLTLVRVNVPEDWTVFSALRSLKIFDASECLGNVPTSFAALPAALDMLKMRWCKVRDLAPRAFAHMSSLNTVHLEGCKIERLRRGVFSGGALVTVSLQNNRISAVEDGAFDDLPNLLFVDLSGNNIASLPVDAFRYNPRVSAILSGNPYNCDCNAKWLMQRADDWKLPNCSEPAAVRGQPMSQLQDYFLSC